MKGEKLMTDRYKNSHIKSKASAKINKCHKKLI